MSANQSKALSRTAPKNMFYVIEATRARSGAWTNQAGRESIGIQPHERVTIINAENERLSVNLGVGKAPTPASKTMRAVAAQPPHIWGIGILPEHMRTLGVKIGDMVIVRTSREPAVAQVVSNRTGSPRQIANGGGTTLKDRMAAMPVGGVIEVSKSAAKSGAYGIAKELSITITKISETSIKRTA